MPTSHTDKVPPVCYDDEVTIRCVTYRYQQPPLSPPTPLHNTRAHTDNYNHNPLQPYSKAANRFLDHYKSYLVWTGEADKVGTPQAVKSGRHRFRLLCPVRNDYGGNR